jgi:hypothetical protein
MPLLCLSLAVECIGFTVLSNEIGALNDGVCCREGFTADDEGSVFSCPVFRPAKRLLVLLPATLFFDGIVINPRSSSSGFAFMIRNLLAMVCFISGALFGLVFGSVTRSNRNVSNYFINAIYFPEKELRVHGNFNLILYTEINK